MDVEEGYEQSSKAKEENRVECPKLARHPMVNGRFRATTILDVSHSFARAVCVRVCYFVAPQSPNSTEQQRETGGKSNKTTLIHM